MDSFLQQIIQGQTAQMPVQMPTQTPVRQIPNQVSTLQNNFNQLQKILQTAKAIQNPVAFLQSQINNSPVVKKAFELGQKYNGNYDAATADILKENNIKPEQFQTFLKQLGL